MGCQILAQCKESHNQTPPKRRFVPAYRLHHHRNANHFINIFALQKGWKVHRALVRDVNQRVIKTRPKKTCFIQLNRVHVFPARPALICPDCLDKMWKKTFFFISLCPIKEKHNAYRVGKRDGDVRARDMRRQHVSHRHLNRVHLRVWARFTCTTTTLVVTPSETHDVCANGFKMCYVLHTQQSSRPQRGPIIHRQQVHTSVSHTNIER